MTTTIDPGGLRAGYVRHCLGLAGRSGVPVAAGAEVSLTRRVPAMPYVAEDFWPAGTEPVTSRPGEALDLLAASIDRAATVVAIGPLTNLALLEVARPGSLARVPLVVMGGWVRPMDADLPAYGPADDWNVAWDTDAARIVLESAGDLTLVTLADTLRTHVRAVHLPRLRSAGPLGELLARQAVAYAELRDHAALARAHEGLPDDLLHFLHDPLACAVALGWPGARTELLRLRPQQAGDGALSMVPDPAGRAVRVVTAVDGPAFAERWLQAVESLPAT